jgi:hypothetical protein
VWNRIANGAMLIPQGIRRDEMYLARVIAGKSSGSAV